MLIVDLHALKPVDILNFLDQVRSQFRHATQSQDIVRSQITFGDGFALLNVFTLEYGDMPPFRDQHFMLNILGIGDDDTAFALGFLAKADCAGRLGQNGRILRFSGLEQIGNAGQTTRNVAGLAGFLRNPGQDVTHAYLIAIMDADDCTRGQEILGCNLR